MTVEELAGRLAGEIADGRRAPGEPLPSVRSLAREAGCAAGTAARALMALRDAGVIVGRERVRFAVAEDGPARAGRWRASGEVLRLAGSDDPALDLLVRLAGPAVVRAPGPRGSLTGLGQLAGGAADAAAIHLLHAGDARYNDRFARAVMAGEPTVLVHLWRREQGLVLPRGNPVGVRGVADLEGRRLAWRAPGTGSRLLLERLLREAGLEPRPEEGTAADSHLGVAAAVAAGAADAGLAVRAVAEATDLEWIPLVTEPFELALRADAPTAPVALLDALASTATQELLAKLPGYDLGESGRTRRLA
jgi:putative molybdopterin biosynthesis protein